MKILKKQYGWIVFIFYIFLGVSCSSTGNDENNQERKMPVRVAPAAIENVSNDLGFTGVVQAYEVAHIAPSMPVRIEKILVDVGDKVSKGQLLVQMDRTQLFQAQVQLKNLEKELSRLDTLLKAGAVTQQNYDQLKTQYDVAKSNIENLSTQTEIRSSLTGVVTGRYYSDGEMFSMTPGPAGKPAIVTINQIQPVKVMINVSERFFPVLQKGQTARVTSDVFPNRVFDGRVNKLSPVVDRASGTFSVEIIIDNNDETLRPGMFARVSLNLGQQDVFLVPALAVLKQSGSDERFVFVVEDQKAVRQTVQTGRKFDAQIEILSGIRQGQQLVVSGQHNLIQGSKVEILNEFTDQKNAKK
ncbi:MAG: efflux RND transporter periplasmic adaptor subunit [Bacteroidales bacterium]